MDERSAQNRSQALAAFVRRLKGSESLDDLRLKMAEKGFKIGQGTLHRALKGELGNRLASLKKIADYAGTTVDQILQFEGEDESYWPFTPQLMSKVRKLDDEQKQALEGVMWAHLGALGEMPARIQASKADDEHAVPPKNTGLAQTNVARGDEVIITPSQSANSDTGTDDVGRR